jgi:hypothetical protein
MKVITLVMLGSFFLLPFLSAIDNGIRYLLRPGR